MKLLRSSLFSGIRYSIMTVTATLCAAAALWAKADVPLFLFSGQSNMTGLGTAVSDLTADQKKPVENIKIDCVSDGNTKKWTTLGPGFGSSSSQFGPELFFGRTLADSMPDRKIAFIKDAKSGTYLGQSGGWLPPSSGGPGTLYKNMMNHIDAALKSFNDAFDTSEYTPRWAGFVWHQGEFDGMDQNLANKYETNLTNLIKDIREKAGTDSLPIIIPMITGTMWQHKDIIQAAEIAVAKKTVNADTMNTEGYVLSDGVHYNSASMEKIGRICAQRWLAMEFTKDWWNPTPVVYQAMPVYPGISGRFVPTGGVLFNLAGRRIGSATSTPGADNAHRGAAALLILKENNGESSEQHFRRMLNISR